MVFDPEEIPTRSPKKKQKDESGLKYARLCVVHVSAKKIHEAMLKQGFKKEVFNLQEANHQVIITF